MGAPEVAATHQAAADLHARVIVTEEPGIGSGPRTGRAAGGFRLRFHRRRSLAEVVPEAHEEQGHGAGDEDAQQGKHPLAAQVLLGLPPLAEVLEVPLHLNRVRGIGPHLHEGLTDGFRDELLQLLVGHVVEAHAQASLSSSASAIA